MKQKMIISFSWSPNNSDLDIPIKHRDALEEDAKCRIFLQIQEGYTSGELHTSVRFGKDEVPEEDEEDGIEYSGSWDMDCENVE